DADARVAAGKLLEHEDVGEEVRARAAVLLRDAHAEQPELAEPREERARKPVRAVPLPRAGRDLRVGELVRERLDLTLLCGELEVHRRSVTPELLRLRLELVADAEARLDEAVAGRAPVDLLPEPPHEDVDGAVAVGLAAAPHLLQQLV